MVLTDTSQVQIDVIKGHLDATFTIKSMSFLKYVLGTRNMAYLNET